jgi:fimbrial isopeptide formation D2 family protein/LPXTG-motif cell wall-anchored protein
MRRRASFICRFLIALLVFGLIVPGALANAETERTTGSLTIHKYEQEPGSPQTDGDGTAGLTPIGELLSGVTFKITQTHQLVFDDGGNEVWTAVEDGQTYEQTTGADGQVVFANLPLGRYLVEEIDAPPHVNRNTNSYFVDIPMTNLDGSTLNYDVHIYPKNETIRGAVELTKVDGDTNQPLPGVEFELYNATDSTIVKVGEVSKFATDARGLIRIDGLAYGSYYFKEVKTLNGYVLGSQKVDFFIKNSGTIDANGVRTGVVTDLNIKNYKSPDIEKEVDISAVNRGEIVTYTLTNELPGDIHLYKQYVIKDVLDQYLSYVEGSWTVDGVDSSALTFARDGQTLTWTVNDFAKLKDIDQITVSFKAKIAEDAPANKVIKNKAVIDFENQYSNGGHKETGDIPVTPTAGYLTVIKQDKSSKDKLAGAVFELRDAEGNLIETGTTDSTGQYKFAKELDYGEYTLIETKAPEGYRKLTKAIKITINSDHHNETVTVDNSKTGWELPKTGGIGTTLFTLAGLALMGTAVYLYIRCRNDTA